MQVRVRGTSFGGPGGLGRPEARKRVVAQVNPPEAFKK